MSSSVTPSAAAAKYSGSASSWFNGPFRPEVGQVSGMTAIRPSPCRPASSAAFGALAAT